MDITTINASDVVSGPFCPYFAWSLRWMDTDKIYLHIFSSLINMGENYTSILGGRLSEENMKNNQCFSISPKTLLVFLIENWKDISSPYIKNHKFEGIVDFSPLDIPVQLLCKNKTITVKTPYGDTENSGSEAIMIVESLLYLGNVLSEGLALLGEEVLGREWADVTRFSHVPPVMGDILDEINVEYIDRCLKWYSENYKIRPQILKKIIIYPFIMQEAHGYMPEQYPDETFIFEGFKRYRDKTLPTSKYLSKVAEQIFKKKAELGLPVEKDWLNIILSQGLMELRNHIYYSKWPEINNETP